MFPVSLALLLLSIASQKYGASAQPTWPASTDELEDIMMLNSGYRARSFADPVTPCSKGAAAGRVTAAEFIRTAFHDMATGNTFTGVGGLDGSIAFEIRSSENVGAAFSTTLSYYQPYFSNQLSLSDIIAAGVYTATRACGGPIIPVRGGRKDATSSGSTGIPLPQNPIGTFKNQFDRIGYDAQQMIAFVACGHTLGAVHAENFPDIAAGDLDSTSSTFDNKIATDFVGGNTKDPLGTWGTKKNSDFVVFTSDNNVTINAMTDPQVFQDTCRTMFQKMIDVVPTGTDLTEPVVPYEVKPYSLQLTLLNGGTQINFAGEIRIRTTTRSVTRVQINFKDRSGSTSSTPITTTLKGNANGFDDTFAFFGFSADLSVDSSVSSFNVIVQSGTTTETFDNNGAGFKVDDSVIYQEPQSCVDASGSLTVVAAVRSNAQAPQLSVIVKNPRASPNPIPSLSTATAAMASQSAVGWYTLYSGSYAFSGSQAQNAVFGVSAGTSSDKNKKIGNLPTACTPLDTSPPTSTPSPSAFTFQGCYSDSGNPRTLPGTISADDEMDIEKCSAFCSEYQFFGLEYGRECYCGNAVDPSADHVGLSDCNMPCAGNSQQTCGAGHRISVYKNNGFKAPVNPTIEGYNYLGCYSEGTNARALGGSLTVSSNMTVERCSVFCNGANYFGVEYGQECYCGAALHETSAEQPDSDCSMRCAGNNTEWCGAGYRLNVYRKTSISTSTAVDAPSSTATTPTVTPTPAPVPSLSGYNYTGCYADTVEDRLLTGKTRLDTQNTYASCAAWCTNYQYFGVEFGSECYCGNTSPPSTLIPKSDSECNVACPGNADNQTYTCGAAYRIAIFKSLSAVIPANPVIEGYNYTGCFTDSVGARILTAGIYFDADMFVGKCAGLCSGYKYFGTEYGGECYCGNEFENPTEEVAEGECSFVCPGNGGEYCGGSGRMSLWERIGNGTAER